MARFAYIFLLVSLTASPGIRATTLVLPGDAQLVDKSDAVVIGTVGRVETRAIDGGIWTETFVVIERSLKGPKLQQIVVREPGGELEGRRVVIFGSPSFVEGQRVLLFLTELRDTTARVTDMAAGYFVSRAPGAPWERPARDANVRVLRDGGSFGAARHVERFPAWIASRAAGIESTPDYELDDSSRRIERDFSLLVEPTVYRWRAFERGSSVPWRSTGTQAGYRDGGRDAIRIGVASWTGYAGANILYRFDGGSAAAPGGLTRSNGINEVMFGDPLGEISGSWNPSTGGVVGVGGFSSAISGGAWTPPFSADPAHGSAPIASTWEITEANLTIQDGVSPSREIPEFDFTELIAHELGHTLGLGHSADPQALMYYQMTGMGPSLRADDQIGARWLYPRSGSSGPPSPPAAPRALTARAEGASSVRLDWIDESSDETGFSVHMALDGAGYRRVAQTEANRTSVVIGSLSAGARYRFVVTSTNSAGESGPSNAVEITIETAQPKAAFGVSPVVGVAGVTEFRFTDQSSGPVSSRLWDFGDGRTATESAPVHVYETPGTRTVTLTVRSSAGTTSSTTRRITVSSPAEPPRAGFSFSPSVATPIDEIEFVDESTGHVQTWNWQFGDDTYSDLQNPRKRYAVPGTYAVTLIVNGQGTQSTATRMITINAGSAGSQTVTAAFELDAGIVVEGRELRFYDLSTGAPNSWYWQFGDGIFSTRQNPTHVYERAGLYSLLFRAGNQASSSSSSRTIRVYPASSVLRLLVPAVADVSGAGASSWRSDLAIFNADGESRDVTIILATSEGERLAREVSIGPGETQVWGNVLRELFDRPSTSGALIIESAAQNARPHLAVSSRTFTRDGIATYGQGVPAIEIRGSSHTLTGLRSNDAFRTNVGIVNTSGESRIVTLRALDAAGRESGVIHHSSSPHSFTQRALSSWFVEGVDSIRTIVIDSDAEGVVAYASVIDNTTQDPIFIAAIDAAQAGASQLLPVAASTSGAAGSRWLSEITIHRSGEAGPVELSLIPMEPGIARTSTVDMIPQETRTLSDAIRAIAGSDGAGAVLFPPGLAVSSRTYTVDSSGGTWGQGVAPVPLSAHSTRAAITGLRADAQFRSNIGIVNTSATSSELTITLFDREGGELEQIRRSVPAGSLVQWGLAALAPELDYSGVFSARIEATQPVVIYASVIDNASGDPSFFLAR